MWQQAQHSTTHPSAVKDIWIVEHVGCMVAVNNCVQVQRVAFLSCITSQTLEHSRMLSVMPDQQTNVRKVARRLTSTSQQNKAAACWWHVGLSRVDVHYPLWRAVAAQHSM